MKCEDLDSLLNKDDKTNAERVALALHCANCPPCGEKVKKQAKEKLAQLPEFMQKLAYQVAGKMADQAMNDDPELQEMLAKHFGTSSLPGEKKSNNRLGETKEDLQKEYDQLDAELAYMLKGVADTIDPKVVMDAMDRIQEKVVDGDDESVELEGSSAAALAAIACVGVNFIKMIGIKGKLEKK